MTHDSSLNGLCGCPRPLQCTEGMRPCLGLTGAADIALVAVASALHAATAGWKTSNGSVDRGKHRGATCRASRGSLGSLGLFEEVEPRRRRAELCRGGLNLSVSWR